MRHRQQRDPKRVEAEDGQRRREKEAPRLRDVVARLESLRLRFEDARPEGQQIVLSYTKPVAIATAPAHFEVCCMDKACDGRHDITRILLRALRASQSICRGQRKCTGMVNGLPCDHTLVYEARVTYSR